MDQKLDQRLEKLEERSVHQELVLEELNQALCDQQKQMDRLTLLLQRLSDQIENMSAAQSIIESGTSQQEVPPHY